jgi:SAM-dependent methyltransferase
MEAGKQWFKDWFNSPYYHLLYNKRDEQEARAFLDKIFDYLKLPQQTLLLDVACGKGRHAKYMAEKGYDVTGIDLSEQSIRIAKKMEQENLHFYQHDMRLPFRINYFDAVFNFFTSFGYFETEREHHNAIRTLANALKPGGIFVFDYLNTPQVAANLVEKEVITKNRVVFDIERAHTNGRFLKRINILDPDLMQRLTFTESVRAFKASEIEALFTQHGLEVKAVFGDYHFNKLDDQNSPRSIWITQKSSHA